MGEAIISRATLIPDEVLNPINPVPGYCVLVLTVKDSSGEIVPNASIKCTDGSASYTYNTNEKGKVRFTTNSGQVNILMYNKLTNNIYMADQANTYINSIEAPIGLVQNIEAKYNRLNSTIMFYPSSNGKYKFMDTDYVTMDIASGGGGGGGCGYCWADNPDGGPSYIGFGCGGGGGGGGIIRSINADVLKTEIYPLFVSSGGIGGSGIRNNYGGAASGSNGGSAGVSSFLNYSVNGGGGGGGGYGDYYGDNRPGKAGTSPSGGGKGGIGRSSYNRANSGRVNGTNGSKGNNNYGGGGAGGGGNGGGSSAGYTYYEFGGNPGGGGWKYTGSSYTYSMDGSTGGGGAGGNTSRLSGGKGGDGYISIICYKR